MISIEIDDKTEAKPSNLFSMSKTGIHIFRDMDCHYNQVKYLSEPTDIHDAATKQYVDDAVASIGSGKDVSVFFGRKFRWSGINRVLQAGEFWISNLVTSTSLLIHKTDLDGMVWNGPADLYNFTTIEGLILTVGKKAGDGVETMLVRKVERYKKFNANEYAFYFTNTDSVLFDSGVPLNDYTDYVFKMTPNGNDKHSVLITRFTNDSSVTELPVTGKCA
jgi:hypothetical protein